MLAERVKPWVEQWEEELKCRAEITARSLSDHPLCFNRALWK